MDNQFEYFLKNLLLFYDIDKSSICYGKEEGAVISITRSVDAAFWSERKAFSGEGIVWKKWKNKNIPFPFENESTEDIITYENDKANINYDIVAATFFFLSGWDEITCAEKDGLGRVKYEGSMVEKLDISNLPVVNYYFDILREAIETIEERELTPNLWGKNAFAVLLSHDIDSCRTGSYKSAVSEYKKRRFLSIPRLMLNRVFYKDEWFNFDKITHIEKQFGATSSFYFLPQRGKAGEWENADYNITSNRIKKVISNLKSKENEIGIHGSFGTHIHSEKLNADIKRIGPDEVYGNRFHFLMFDPGKTVNVLEKCNIKYDTSLCFAERIGFRRGTCYPYYLYDFINKQISGVMEIPLIVMDTTLADNKYMDIKPLDALPAITELIDEIEKFSGVFTLLWHNTYFSEYKYPGWKDVYVKILDYCKSRQGILTNGRVIYEKIRP